jgi:molybdate transport system substrate-binding protein
MRVQSLTLLVAILLASTLGIACNDARVTRELQVRCAATFEAPLRELAEEFRAETGIELQLGFGPSLDLAQELETDRAADLYLFDDEELAFAARKLDIVREVMHLAVLRPVLAAPAGNPAGISELADLAREELRVGIPDPEHCGLGLHVRTAARYIGAWHQTRELADRVTTTESELAAALVAGEIDVAVIWDATAERTPGIERIEELKLEGHARRMTLAVGTAATHVSDAMTFARWLRSTDRGRPVLERHGFVCIDGGDDFVLTPKLRVFLSQSLHAAADPALAEWSRREGAELELVPLQGDALADRATTERPHALFVFDDRLLTGVGPDYDDREVISSDPLTLVVYGMNPEGVGSLNDLAFDGLRVGLLAREASELGALAWDELDRRGIGDQLRARSSLVVADDAEVLLDAVRRKDLDAVLLHGTAAGAPTMRNDVIPLVHPEAELEQCFALRADQEYPELARRLRDSLRTRETNERFFHLGFRWLPRDAAATEQH